MTDLDKKNSETALRLFQSFNNNENKNFSFDENLFFVSAA